MCLLSHKDFDGTPLTFLKIERAPKTVTLQFKFVPVNVRKGKSNGYIIEGTPKLGRLTFAAKLVH
jgi:hypothetical protein